MLMALLGFLAPFIPDVLGMGKQWMDHRQELELVRMRHEQAKDEATWRMAEIEAQADIAEMKELRKPHKSYGVQLLDKGADNDKVWPWAFNFAFLAFSFLDWLISSVRPGITYLAFGLYMTVKGFTLAEVYRITGDLTTTFMNEAAWSQFDQELLILVVSFWFGQRARSGRASQAFKAFG